MKAITLAVLMLALALPGFTQTPAVPADSPVAEPNSEIVVPADTTIPMILINTINTKSAYVGQSLYCDSI